MKNGQLFSFRVSGKFRLPGLQGQTEHQREHVWTEKVVAWALKDHGDVDGTSSAWF